ncbi:unnamed protein product [Periconia digitata]|uniref:Uncharacterized protein n=1 Tax=Periconia digitata TaxID=1303443 RepID=A0A9W4U7K0_9PLEO|nr:unnamed protein product [Periconia digitata]
MATAATLTPTPIFVSACLVLPFILPIGIVVMVQVQFVIKLLVQNRIDTKLGLVEFFGLASAIDPRLDHPRDLIEHFDELLLIEFLEFHCLHGMIVFGNVLAAVIAKTIVDQLDVVTGVYV